MSDTCWAGGRKQHQHQQQHQLEGVKHINYQSIKWKTTERDTKTYVCHHRHRPHRINTDPQIHNKYLHCIVSYSKVHPQDIALASSVTFSSSYSMTRYCRPICRTVASPTDKITSLNRIESDSNPNISLRTLCIQKRLEWPGDTRRAHADSIKLTSQLVLFNRRHQFNLHTDTINRS